ncbi:DNA polymerase III subunit alpha [Candidatus Poribacteria bacterium]|nr:DNA polymerase III subunit alpha [Candidatus Poribacteria bacterium]
MLKHSNFVHLHVHTEYSLLDGEIQIARLVEQAKKFHMPALAITDHGNMFGAIAFYEQAIKSGIKPIIGCEVYVAPGSRFDKDKIRHKDTAYHLTLLAEDETGYQNLMKLSTAGYLEGFYYKPRVDKELLAQYSKGIIALSGCLKGEIPLYVLKGETKYAQDTIRQYQDIFGKRNFYLELQANSIHDQNIVNAQLTQLGKEMHVPLVATNDCHYLIREEAKAHDILLCLQTGTTLDAEDRMRFSTDDFYFCSTDEMKKKFEEVPRAILNTIEIAERCNVELKFNQTILPHYVVPETYTLETYLSSLCEEGLKTHYKEITPEIRTRLNYELEIINKMGYAGYFLIVWDVIHYARTKDIPVGPGRGSAAGSLVAYVLGITNLDPLKYALLFERFLNPERISMPDIDMDFCYRRREEVINYVSEKYGKDCVAQIITFGTMGARAGIRDVGRVLSLPLQEVDKIAKLIPTELNITLSRALETEPQLQKLIDERKEIAELFHQAQVLEGVTRHASTHAAGLVISREPLITYCPLYKGSKDEITTQYDMNAIAKIGLLKMDFLGLLTLTMMKDTLNIIKRTRNFELDIDNLSLNDKKTYKLITNGQTIGVFQLESSGMRDILRKIKPNKFEDLIAVLALYRPGPLGSGMVDDFVERKHGLRENKPLHPKLENTLKDTYGVILYQEQVMQIANILSGFTMGQADSLRKAMGKKIPEVMEEQRKYFVEGAVKNDVKKETAEYIFDLIAKFAGYGFNKSHSAAYALISYQTAYLKANYPTEFMAAILTSKMGDIKEVVFYIKECEKMEIKILPPDVNQSFRGFTVIDENTIRFGLAAIKNVGGGAIDSIITAREKEGAFKSIHKFCELIDARLVNKRVIESLIKCGAFDSLGNRRSQLAEGLESIMGAAFKIQNDKSSGQISLFSEFEQAENNVYSYQPLPQIDEWQENILLAGEKETLGLYLTGHPLARFEKEIKTYSNVSTISIANVNDGKEIIIAGIIAGISIKTTKKGDRMAILNFEDLKGNVEVVFFPDKYRLNSEQLYEDAIIFVKGRVDATGENPKIIGAEVITVDEIKNKLVSKVHIKLNTVGLEESTLEDIKIIIKKHKGKCSTYLHFIDPAGKETVIKANPEHAVNPTAGFINAMERIVGEDAVWFSE